MSQQLQWIENVNNLQIMEHPADSDKGYILEVDLEYRHELYDTHYSHQLTPERSVVQKEWMSEYQLNIQNKSNEVDKLVTNLRDKYKYILHYRNLQLYLSLDIKPEKYKEYLNLSSGWNRMFL